MHKQKNLRLTELAELEKGALADLVDSFTSAKFKKPREDRKTGRKTGDGRLLRNEHTYFCCEKVRK